MNFVVVVAVVVERRDLKTLQSLNLGKKLFPLRITRGYCYRCRTIFDIYHVCVYVCVCVCVRVYAHTTTTTTTIFVLFYFEKRSAQSMSGPPIGNLS